MGSKFLSFNSIGMSFALSGIKHVNFAKMITTIMILLGMLGFGLCYKSINWFDKL